MTKLIDMDEAFVAIFGEFVFERLSRQPSEDHARAFIEGLSQGAEMLEGVVRAFVLGSDDTEMIAAYGRVQSNAAFAALALMHSQQ